MSEDVLIGRTDDWWAGYRAGCEAAHANDCTATAAERDSLRRQLDEAHATTEQRIADLQAEMRRQVRVLERKLDQARPVCGWRGMAATEATPGPGCIRHEGHPGRHGFADGSGEQDAPR